jgi:hypothetical protein
VLAHARALLLGQSDGATAYLDADVRDADRILAEAAETLDFTQPVALTLVSLLHFLTDSDDPYATVARLVAALPSGSYLVISHGTYEVLPPAQAAQFTALNAASPVPFRPRDRVEVGRFFDGLDLVDPGIVPVAAWRDDDRRQTTCRTTGRSPSSRSLSHRPIWSPLARCSKAEPAATTKIGFTRLGRRSVTIRSLCATMTAMAIELGAAMTEPEPGTGLPDGPMSDLAAASTRVCGRHRR